LDRNLIVKVLCASCQAPGGRCGASRMARRVPRKFHTTERPACRGRIFPFTSPKILVFYIFPTVRAGPRGRPDNTAHNDLTRPGHPPLADVIENKCSTKTGFRQDFSHVGIEVCLPPCPDGRRSRACVLSPSRAEVSTIGRRETRDLEAGWSLTRAPSSEIIDINDLTEMIVGRESTCTQSGR
jgi:hypothetical protein